ncbi:MAG: hypothetical protein MUF43_13355 [Flavobacterium sp.]|nr:hypothetical protein [Flavobacterium sp.]
MKNNTLHSGQSLWRNKSSENKLVSENGLYELVLQEDDGNLVLYENQPNNRFPVFASNTQNSKVEAAVFQEDGNFVLYENGADRKNPKWASSTQNISANKLKLENSGAICLYDKNDKLVFVINSQRWMSALKDSQTLNDICMPGSHDAGMYSTSFFQLGQGLALTQSKNIREQLDFGIRYFDLRPEYDPSKSGENRFNVYHGPAAGPLIKDILNDIKSFFEHPNGKKETVIIGLTHFKEFHDYVKINLLKFIIEKLEGLIYKLSHYDNLGNVKLSEVRGKIIFLLDVDVKEFNKLTSGNNISNFFTTRTFGSCVFDEYSNTMDYTEMHKKQIAHFKSFNEEKLFLLNWTLTPPDDTMGKILIAHQEFEKTFFPVISLIKKLVGIDPDKINIKKFAEEINPHLCRWGHAREGLFKPNQYGKIVNIINGDFWEVSGNDVLKVCFEIMNNK